MLIIGMSLLYSYVMSYLHISQSTAEWIVSLHLRVGSSGDHPTDGCGARIFLPPVSIILMTAPIILPPLRAANFDLIWFGVIMTIVMEMGLIHPPSALIFSSLTILRLISPEGRDVGVLPLLG